MADPPARVGDASGRDAKADLGFTHVALAVSDLEASLDFYERYASMRVVHRRRDEQTGTEVAWISDRSRPFVIVLITSAVTHTLGGWAHLGVACPTRAEIDRLCETAVAEGRRVEGPHDSGPPVGYWAFIADPDGHNLEISYGQVVELAVREGSQP